MKKCIFIAAWIFLISFLYAQEIPLKISYQGKLLEGNSPVNGMKNITFTIGSWSETKSVLIEGGLYSVTLGETNPIPVSIFNSTSAISLKITVNGSELAPHTEILSVPYSYKAEKAVDTKNISGNPVSTITPSVNEILKWDGTQWRPASDNSGGPSASPAGGDLLGTYPNPTVAKIQEKAVSAASPSDGQVLKWNSNSNNWAPGTDIGTSYTGGTGIEISGSTISAQTSIALWNAEALQGSPISSTAPSSSGQVLKWNGSSWAAATISGGVSPWTQNGSNIYYNSGNVGIGTANPLQRLYVAGGTIEVYPESDGQRGLRLRSANQTENFVIDSRDNGVGEFVGASQFVFRSTFGIEVRNMTTGWTPVNASAFNVQSSRSLKTNINHIEQSRSLYWLEQILRMKAANYIYNWETESTKSQLGFIVEEIPEELKGQDGKSVNLYALTSAGIVSIQALYQMLEKQQALIKKLHEEIEAIKNKEELE